MKNTQDLLHGNIRRELIALTIPLVLGNILQQFYNTIDSFIVGRYVGTEAFAGIGVAGSIMNLFIFILNGGCNGMSIIFAELYGQKNYEKLRKESFLSLSAGGGFTIVLSIASLLVLYPVLGLIQTPLEVEPYVVAYLRIIFIGLPATFLYNWCSAVLRAAGDTETPLWTLFIAMCMNLALDVAFVLGLHMGTAGTALATVIAQLFSAGVCLWIMRKKHPIFFFSRKDMGMDLPLLKRTANFGAVSALHQSSIYIGKMLVQGAVNSGGTEIISAYTATTRIEGFSNSFGDSGSTAISVFVAQNRGAGDKKRALKGFHQGLGLICHHSVCPAGNPDKRRGTASHGESVRNRNEKCRIVYECGICLLYPEFHRKRRGGILPWNRKDFRPGDWKHAAYIHSSGSVLSAHRQNGT